MENNSRTQTIIQEVEKHAIQKGRNILYLVLKKKTKDTKFIEDLEDEIEKRMGNFINKMSNKLLNTKFDNPEESLKYILLKALSIILEELLKELEFQLSPHDKELLNTIPFNFPASSPVNVPPEGQATITNKKDPINCQNKNYNNGKKDKENPKQSEYSFLGSFFSCFQKDK